MVSKETRQPRYALGHSERELERLSTQARAFEPFTRQLLAEAGIEQGMRVLDVGCGSGDVTFLAAEIVGVDGAVLGVDRALEAVERARNRASARRIANVRFAEGDSAEMDFNREFDAVVGRFVLMHYPDAVAALRKLASRVRGGGLVVFQELDEQNCRTIPSTPLFARATTWIKSALVSGGATLQMGLRLYPTFLAAGLPAPTLRMDSLIEGAPSARTFRLLTDLIETLLPVMEKFGIATREEAAIATLEQRMRDQAVAANGIVLSPALIGAWARKP